MIKKNPSFSPKKHLSNSISQILKKYMQPLVRSLDSSITFQLRWQNFSILTARQAVAMNSNNVLDGRQL